MGRAPCCKKEGLRKGAWTAEEDEKLLSFIHKNSGHGSWRTLPQLAGLERCGKSCRLRWTNYLRPNIKRGNLTPEEERTIIQLHELLGNKWAGIASHLPGRTDNEVKNHWNTHLKKRLSRMGIDPVTHRPASVPQLDFNSVNTRDGSMMKKLQNTSLNCNHTNRLPKVTLLDQSFVSHMAQWELARLEAEARLMSAKSSSSTAFISQASTDSRGQGKENELLEVFRELLEAPISGHEKSSPVPSLDSSNTSSSACSQFMNEAEITSDLTYIHSYMSPSPSSQFHDPLLALIPASPQLPPSEATSHAYWANMLSLVGTVMSSCPC